MERKRSVLVIDDEEHLRNMLRRALSPEHDVVLVAGAQEALGRIAAGERFDLILCDLMLPVVTGMDFHVLVGQAAPELVERTVFTTGGAYTDAARAFIARADICHVDKPFPPLGELRSLVRNLLQRQRPTSETT